MRNTKNSVETRVDFKKVLTRGLENNPAVRSRIKEDVTPIELEIEK